MSKSLKLSSRISTQAFVSPWEGRKNRTFHVSSLAPTGATTTSVPGDLAASLDLQAGRAINVQTAAGTTRAYLTRLNSLNMAGIELNNVRATIIPEMNADEVLLGMNVLKDMELIQRGNELIIRQFSR